MRAVLSLLVCLTVPVTGQSALPPCNPNVAATSSTNCQGIFTLANGDKYVGELRDGKRHGQGTETYANGDKYVGEWRDDTANGHGSYTWANGDKYVGEFRHDKFHGQGALTYADGSPPEKGVWGEDAKFVRAQSIPDHITGRTSTPRVARAPRQAEPPRSNLTPGDYALTPGDYARYQDAIRFRIRSRIRFDPTRGPSNPEVIYVVEQLPTGQISRIEVQGASGLEEWDVAVRRAIEASDPLPKVANGSVERRLELRFRPLDKR